MKIKEWTVKNKRNKKNMKYVIWNEYKKNKYKVENWIKSMNKIQEVTKKNKRNYKVTAKQYKTI